MQFDSPLIQGPLAGISCAPFRRLAFKYGHVAFCCTEMISAKTLLSKNQVRHRYCYKDPKEKTTCYQLSGTNPSELHEATHIAVSYGADMIDLNCGCPMPKIRQKGAGSSHIKNIDNLHDCILAMRRATTKPLSIKVRVDGSSGDDCNKDLIACIQSSPLDFCTVHGRHWQDDYTVQCYYDQIAFFAESLAIPVIGNGDITSADSLSKMMQTGAKGFMVGRAGVGQPWLFNNLLSKNKIIPTRELVINTLMDHVKALSLLVKSEKKALLEARKFTPYYLKVMGIKTQRCLMSSINTLIDLEYWLNQHFDHQGIV